MIVIRVHAGAPLSSRCAAAVECPHSACQRRCAERARAWPGAIQAPQVPTCLDDQMTTKRIRSHCHFETIATCYSQNFSKESDMHLLCAEKGCGRHCSLASSTGAGSCSRKWHCRSATPAAPCQLGDKLEDGLQSISTPAQVSSSLPHSKHCCHSPLSLKMRAGPARPRDSRLRSAGAPAGTAQHGPSTSANTPLLCPASAAGILVGLAQPGLQDAAGSARQPGMQLPPVTPAAPEVRVTRAGRPTSADLPTRQAAAGPIRQAGLSKAPAPAVPAPAPSKRPNPLKTTSTRAAAKRAHSQRRPAAKPAKRAREADLAATLEPTRMVMARLIAKLEGEQEKAAWKRKLEKLQDSIDKCREQVD